MKKIISLLIIVSALLSLVACGAEYPPVESTKEEATVLFTLTADGVSCDVKYELYRALFLAHKGEVDGGDATVWSGERRDEYIAKINEIIIPKIADIYATIRLAEKIGVNFNSKEVDNTVESFIDESVNGGTYADGIVKGYGSYEKYLEGLRSAGLNYSVQILLYHYAIAQSKIAEYYIGTITPDNITPDSTPGNLEYTPEDVRDYYYSDECVRVLCAFIQEKIGKARAESIRSGMLKKYGDEAVGLYITQNTTASAEEGEGGMLVGRHSLDAVYYSELTETAFSLSLGEVSDVLKIENYHILYRAEKSQEHFENYYYSVLDSYLNNEIGKMINNLAVEMTESISYTDAYRALSHANIKMS